MRNFDLKNFANILNVSGVAAPEIYDDLSNMKVNPFTDMGSWHGYYNLNKENTELYGGFSGPFIIAEEFGVSLSKSISKIELVDNKNNTIDLSKAEKVEFNYYPGKLEQKYTVGTLELIVSLIFANNRTALIEYKIRNNHIENLFFRIGFNGDIYNVAGEDIIRVDCQGNKYESRELGQKIVTTENGLKVKFSKIRCPWVYYATDETAFNINYSIPMNNTVNDNAYESLSTEYIEIGANKEKSIYVTHSYTFTKEEEIEELNKVQEFFNNPCKILQDNETRWYGYLEKTIKEKNKYTKVAVKAVETLMTNWRSKAGAFLHDGVTPSLAYKWFNGIWAWDSWKQAVATSYFNGQLAKDNIRAMFDYQIGKDDDIRPQDAGTIIDCVFYNKGTERGGDGSNWNERDSKPALAAWALWEVYKNTEDVSFMEEMYPRLVAYHKWWYTNRDHDKNGVAEYGAMVHPIHFNDDGTFNQKRILEAAAWESGMDNATRFDIEGFGTDDIGIKIFENKNKDGQVIGYSINQESVCLNAYLYAEKIFLASMAEKLGYNEDVEKYKAEAKILKEYINTNMFDKETGFYYDLQFDENGNKKLLVNRGKGTEGWIPLWANLATEEIAKSVRDNIVDENKFNTLMPFPTASKDNPKYAPEKYWRGPVWLDQAIYGVEALLNYGYVEDAMLMSKKLFENAEGLMEDGPIRENYNPETGRGLHASNFSWSASAFYIIYKKVLENIKE